MKRKFIVRAVFVNEFEAESDIQALVDAAYAVKYGSETVRHLELKVVNVQPLPPQSEAPAPQEETAKAEEALPEPAKDAGYPF